MLHSGAHRYISALLVYAHAQNRRELDNYFDSRIADAALDAAQISAVEVGSFGEFVL